MYKVNYKTYAIMPDGRIGNIWQKNTTVYTNAKIENIETELNKYLEKSKEVCVITDIYLVENSHVIEVKDEN